jgi:acyl carrier protein
VTSTPDELHLRAEIRRFLRHELSLEELDDETPLGALGLDSLQVIALVTEIEALFGLAVPEEELFFERNWSVTGFARLILDGHPGARGRAG